MPEFMPLFGGKRGEIFYFDRKFREEESAIRLKLFNSDRKYRRTDLAIDYEKFQKK